MTDTSGQNNPAVPPVAIDPGLIGLVSSVFGDTKTPQPPPDPSGKEDETFYEKTSDEFRKAVDTVNSVSKLVGNTISAAAGTVAGAGAQGQAATNQASIGIQKEQEAQTRKAVIEGAARDKEINDNLTVATAENLTAPQMVQRANRLSMLADNIQSENDDLRQRASTSIFDDPLTFIQNLFTTPFVKRKHDADLESFKEESAILKEQQIQTSDAYKVNAGVDAAHGIEYTKTITDALAAQAIQKQAAVTLEAARFTSINAQATASLTEAQLSNAVKTASVANSAAVEARSKYIFDMNTGNLEGRAAITQQRAKDLKESDTENRIATAGLGIPGLNNTNIKQLKGPQAQAFEIAKNSIYGGVAAGQSPAEASLGPDPLTAVWVKQTLGIKMNNPAAEDTATWIKGIQASTMGQRLKGEGGQSITVRSLKPDAQNTIVNENIQANLDTLYSNIPASGSPLSPAPLATILKAPLFAGTDLGKALAPLAINSLAPIDFNVMGEQALKMVEGGKSIPEVAAQMKILGQTMTSQVNQFRGLSRLGITPLGTDQLPGFKVNTTNGAGGIANVDLNSQPAIENWINRSLVTRKTAQFYVDVPLVTGLN